MPVLHIAIEISFVENTGRRCVPACAAMVLKTLMPERDFTKTEVEEMCGFRPDRSTWAAQHLISLSKLGLDVGWIEDDDLERFARAPLSVKHEQSSSDEEFENFILANDLDAEARRAQEYLDMGLPFEQRRAIPDDITNLMEQGWLVRLEVNGKRLADQEGYANHAVMVSGYNDDVVRLENPDGVYGSKPGQLVSWDLLTEVMTDNPGSQGALQYYRRVSSDNGAAV